MVEVSVQFDWTELGKVVLDRAGKIKFPKANTHPAIYRLELVLNGGRSVYIGETDNLARRFQHYRTPGPTQATNQRINPFIVATLQAGGEALIAVSAGQIRFRIGENERTASLESKAERVLVEHAALLVEYSLSVQLLNA